VPAASKKSLPFRYLRVLLASCFTGYLWLSLVRVHMIVGGAMEDTLLHGDLIASAQFVYRIPFPFFRNMLLRSPKRGDVVTYRQEGESHVSRCVGLSGDVIEVRESGALYVNGKLQDEPFLNLESFGRRESNRIESFGPEIVPQGGMFLLGDHRNRSADSRFVGSVPVSDVEGRPVLVLWSLRPDPFVDSRPPLWMDPHWLQDTRWKRVLLRIRSRDSRTSQRDAEATP